MSGCDSSKDIDYMNSAGRGARSIGRSESISSNRDGRGMDNSNSDNGRVSGERMEDVGTRSDTSSSISASAASVGNADSAPAGNAGGSTSSGNIRRTHADFSGRNNATGIGHSVNHNSNHAYESDSKYQNIGTPTPEVVATGGATSSSTLATNPVPTTNIFHDPRIGFMSSGFSSGGSPHIALTPGNQYGGIWSSTDSSRQRRIEEDQQRQYFQRWFQSMFPSMGSAGGIPDIGRQESSAMPGVAPIRESHIDINGQSHISDSSAHLISSVGARQVIIKEGNPNPAEIANLRSYHGPDEEQYYTGGEDFLYQFNAATAVTFKLPTQKIAAFRTKMAGPAMIWYKRLTALQTATWEKLVEAFLQYSIRVGYGEDYQTQLSRCVQKEGELSGTYYTRLLDIQDRANCAALMAAPSHIRQAIQDCKAKQQQAVAVYQENATTENEQKLNRWVQMVSFQEFAVPNRISDEAVRTQWRAHLLYPLKNFVQMKADPYSSRPFEDLLQAVILEERYMIQSKQLSPAVLKTDEITGAETGTGAGNEDKSGLFINNKRKGKFNGNFLTPKPERKNKERSQPSAKKTSPKATPNKPTGAPGGATSNPPQIKKEGDDSNTGGDTNQYPPRKRYKGPKGTQYSGCFRCGDVSHLKRDCPLQLAEGEQEKPARAQPIAIEGDNGDTPLSLLVSGTVGKKSMSGEIALDSCAEVSLVRQSFVKSLGSVRQEEFQMKMFSQAGRNTLILKGIGGQAKALGVIHLPVVLGQGDSQSEQEIFIKFYIVEKLAYPVLIAFEKWHGLIKSLDVERGEIVLTDQHRATRVPFHRPKNIRESITLIPEQPSRRARVNTRPLKETASSSSPSSNESGSRTPAAGTRQQTVADNGRGDQGGQGSDQARSGGGQVGAQGTPSSASQRTIPKKAGRSQISQAREQKKGRAGARPTPPVAGASAAQRSAPSGGQPQGNVPMGSNDQSFSSTAAEASITDERKDEEAGTVGPQIRQAHVVRLMRTVVVPARSEMSVQISSSSNVKQVTPGKDYMLEASRSKMVQVPTGIAVARSLVHIQRDGVDSPIYTNVINSSDRPVTMRVGTIIGKLTEFGDSVTRVTRDGHLDTAQLKDQKPVDLKKTVDFTDTVLTSKQQQQLLILLEKYRDRFAKNSKAPGVTPLTMHDIDTGDAPPVKSGPARASPAEQKEIKEAIEGMLRGGIIQRSQSPWASRVVLSPKKDGTMRFCVDYRKLNELTVKDSYPLPHTQDVLDYMSTAQFFSTMDLASGFWQIPLTKRAREKSAFVSKFGLFEFLVMPFGLTNAPATFQRTMDIILSGLTWMECMVYMDDIVIFSNTWKEHLLHLEHVLDRLRKAGLVLKAEKCFFGRTSLPFLGHIISREGVAVDPFKVAAIQKLPRPNNVSEVRALLGMFGYYRRFFSDFATIAEPLHQLLKKNKVFAWTDEAELAFNQLRDALLHAPILIRPDFRREFVIVTDASNVGLGAVLEQSKQDGGDRHAIAYWSRSLQKRERKYTVTERECLAVVDAIKHFRHYIYGSHFVVVTDHNALKWLQSARDLSDRLQRWALKLQGHNFSIEYRKGKENGNADGLSRLVVYQDHIFRVNIGTRSRNPIETRDEEIEPERESPEVEWDSQQGDAWDIVDLEAIDQEAALKAHEINFEQQTDPFLRPIAIHLKGKPIGQMTPDEQHQLTQVDIADFELKGGLLYHKHKLKNGTILKQVAIPVSLRDEYKIHVHEGLASGGHLGINKAYEKLLCRYWWPNMLNDLEQWIKSCPQCQAKKDGPRVPIPIQPSIVVSAPFACLGVDVLGPLPATRRGFSYIIVFCDYLTRWVEAFPMRRNDEVTCAKILVEQIVCRYGAPRRLLSDRGKPFISRLAHEVYKLLDIHKLNTSAYHPQTNGVVERFNSTLAAMLAMYVSIDQRDWDKYIPYCVYAYNTSRHEINKFSPYYLLFGREPTLPVDVMSRTDDELFTNGTDYARSIIRRMRVAHRLAEKNQREIHQKYADKAVMIDIPEYEPGNLVYVQYYQPKVGLTAKLSLLWRGPFEIIKKLSNVTYEVQVYQPERRGKHARMIVHVRRLKKFHMIPSRYRQYHAIDEQIEQQRQITNDTLEAIVLQ
jgi:hypothetical protein